jgi:hypothetical protein
MRWTGVVYEELGRVVGVEKGIGGRYQASGGGW